MHACLITIGQIHDLGTPRLASEANLIVAFESTPAGTATARIVLYCFPTYFSSFCTSPHAPCSMHAPLKIILQERVISLLIPAWYSPIHAWYSRLRSVATANLGDSGLEFADVEAAITSFTEVIAAGTVLANFTVGHNNSCYVRQLRALDILVTHRLFFPSSSSSFSSLSRFLVVRCGPVSMPLSALHGHIRHAPNEQR